MDEDDTVSVSKGVFVFRKKFKPKKSKYRKHEYENSLFSSHLWYRSYSELWRNLEREIEELNFQMFSEILENLVNFVKNGCDDNNEEIPTAALLTGINMPDHGVQFAALAKLIKQSVTHHVVSLSSQNCQNIKYLMEHMINQFINENDRVLEEDMDTVDRKPYIKKSQMNLSVLQCWYENLYKENVTSGSPKKQRTKVKKKPLVVILPDFESINPEVLQKLILITSWYTKTLPFIFIFGIATSISTVHTFLPYHVSSKISLKIFKSEPSTVYLNNILENILFHKNCPFHLGGKVFNLFTDIFLYYDLSVNNFIQNFKFALLQHFCCGNAMALCNLNKVTTKQVIKNFLHEDLESVRHFMSFRKLVENESYENRIALLTDDDYFRAVLSEKIIEIQKYIRRLHIFLECLLILVRDLPKTPLGKQRRELYSYVVTKNITESPEYIECFQLLGFQSKEELSLKLEKIKAHVSIYLRGTKGKILDFVEELEVFLAQMNNFDMTNIEEAVDEIGEESQVEINGITDRKQFKEKLLGLSKRTKPLNHYEKLRQNILETLQKVFKEYLVEPKTFYFHEIFFYDDISIRNYIIGTHRAAIHSALNDPQHYLQCDCCIIPNSSSITPFMPDICIAYKLYLECGKMINLYDWLQAFLSIVDPTEFEEESKRVVDPELQARFTQAVAELEYLGFIKSSKRKADHVTRLTWGG